MENLIEQVLQTLVTMKLAELGIIFDHIMEKSVWIVVALSIPSLIVAAAYCFFGVRIYRILLVLSWAFNGGIAGAVFLGLLLLKVKPVVGVAVGFVLFAAIFGLLSWLFYKLFLFLEAFWGGMSITFLTLFVITEKLVVSIAAGAVVGLAFGVLVCIYAKLFIMIITAYKGAGSIAGMLSLFFIAAKPPLHSVINLSLFVAFGALGFFVQYRFFANSYNRGGKKNSARAKYKLIGIGGAYKGIEFDIDGTLTLGRDEDSCNVVFPDTCAGVSRIQCEVRYDSKTKSVTIVDKLSSYGTKLNGTKIENDKATPLNNGDVIMFGEDNVFKLGC